MPARGKQRVLREHTWVHKSTGSIRNFVIMITRNVKTKYDLNLLLGIANVFVCGVCIFLYNIEDNNGPVNVITLVLIAFFAIENIGMLSYEKRRRSPFIIILVLVVTVFYMTRVATILHIPASASLWGHSSIPSASDLNYSLMFILLSNVSMFLGFYFAGEYNKNRKKIICEEDNFPQIRNVIIIIALVVSVNFFNVLNFESLGRLTGYIQTFLNRDTILLFTFTMLAYHYNKISLRTRMLFVVIISLIVILITLSGSRSGVLSVGMVLLMGILAVKQKIMVSKKVILVSLIIIPISIIFFATATFIQHQGIKGAITIIQHQGIKGAITIEHLAVAKAKGSQALEHDHIIDYLSLIYYRLGFLDFSTELIANRQKFARIINGQYYAESIVDNVLTPGFDIFGTPRASHALSYTRRNEPVPDIDQIMSAYQSDQMGIYGEYYVFFNGYSALAVFFFLAFIYQVIYSNLQTTNGLLTCIYRAVLLNLFYLWLNSFGMDWFAFDLIIAVITTFIFARYYFSKGKRKIVFRIEPEKDAGATFAK